MAQDALPNLVGNSPRMRELKVQIAQIANADFPVLILGESGSGKEVVARAIHSLSPRAAAPFVGQSCLAIPETLIESELFGHEAGAFTDAHERRIGLFEQAQGGSLFLDEIGDIPLGFQKRLLRVLQEREVRRLGGTDAVAIDVRIMAATNAPLEQMVSDGRFRMDLLHRLNTFEIRVPPLRQRPEDVPALVEHFIARHMRRYGTRVEAPDARTVAKLKDYPWPGNVRELENFVVRWISLGDEALAALDKRVTLSFETQDISRRWLSMTMDEIEAEVIRLVLADCGNNKSVCAKRLGLARKSLYNKMERYGIPGVESRR
ncbi:MAG: sigma-54-dependent Fis family transcriptional regulator [Planctomycetes bacterium]|jgi:DNA-binding NtrC family response regulator|nr:sigma-54-dependent Fis family transcriptional regulator [Planctomycetota bacterium]MCL4730437.1 sigma-54 dependent transcriptional regulator [Planctomycetota bacterium]